MKFFLAVLTLAVLTLALICIVPHNAFGDPPTATEDDRLPAPATKEATAAPTEAVTEAPATPNEIITDLGKVIGDWKNLGWVAGLIALINLLLTILRLKPLNDFLNDKDLKWLKPLVACVLGGALGGLSTFQTGAPVLNSVIAGFLTALGSVGFHEFLDKMVKRTTKKPQPALGAE